MWRIWCQASEEYLCTRASLAGNSLNEHLCRGRGVVKFVKRVIGGAQNGVGAANNYKACKLGKLKRRLVDLLTQKLRGRSKEVHQQLWDKCRRAGKVLVPRTCCSHVWRCVVTPCAEDIKQVIHYTSQTTSDLATAARKEREKSWKERFVADWAHGGSSCFAWCKGESQEKADMISRPDGTLTCESEEMDALVRDAWLPIFQMYKTSPAPSWNNFENRFGQHFPPNALCNLNHLKGTTYVVP